jgi:tetratricopeptide (TPR) repeat protein
VGTDPNVPPGLPDPARCLLAIREARIALAHKPDDPHAFRLLSSAYRLLMLQEVALLAGIELKPENAERIARLTTHPGLLQNRFRQLVTALNYAIQTTPPPRTLAARQDLQRLNLELFELYRSANYLDLARDRLQAALEANHPGDLTTDDAINRFEQAQQNLAQLTERINQIRSRMDELQLEQTSPVQLGLFALEQGAPQLAQAQFESAQQNGMSPAVVNPQLVDLYCNTGQPEKASELMSGNVEDPTLETEPGMAVFRNGLINLLLGNYEYAATLWGERALPRLRFERGRQALLAAQQFIRGEIKGASNAFLTAPGRISTQALWEYDLALCLLESGGPEKAAEHFTRALTLAPDLPTRPVIAYYLTKIGKPVPPPSSTAAKPPTPGQSVGPNLPGTAPPVDEKR